MEGSDSLSKAIVIHGIQAYQPVHLAGQRAVIQQGLEMRYPVRLVVKKLEKVVPLVRRDASHAHTRADKRVSVAKAAIRPIFRRLRPWPHRERNDDHQRDQRRDEKLGGLRPHHS